MYRAPRKTYGSEYERFLNGEYGVEYERIFRGGLASSTQARLAELTGWGGSTSFLTAREHAVASEVGVRPVGQVVGLSAGAVLRGVLRTTEPGQGRLRLGRARWRERTGLARSWSSLRRRALARLVNQAEMLGADAVIGLVPHYEGPVADVLAETGASVSFTGTAVRVESWRGRGTAPVLTYASGQELWAMLRAGIAPVGVAGGFACVETLPSALTVRASVRRRGTPSQELPDLTRSVYEARRLALGRLVESAGELGADGLLGIRLEVAGIDSANSPLSGFVLSVRVEASAVRRSTTASLPVTTVVRTTDDG